MFAVMTNRDHFLLALLVALFFVFTIHFLNFPGSVPNFVKSSNGGVLLDAVPSFSEDELYRRLAEYGVEGRRNYTRRNLTVDLILPIGVLPFLLILMRLALNKFAMGRITQLMLLSLPLAYVALDFAENGAVLVLLSNFPERVHHVAGIVPYLTVLKRAASMLAIFIPLIILVSSLVSRRTKGVYTKDPS